MGFKFDRRFLIFEHSTEPSWSMVTLWYLLSSYYFYCTGHQATLPAIRFEAAFVGFPAGDVKSVVFPGNVGVCI